MMKKLNLWMLAAIMTACGAMVMGLTSCSDSDDPVANPDKGDALKEKLVGEWITEMQVDNTEAEYLDGEAESSANGYTVAFIYHFYDDGTCWKEVDVMKDGRLVAQPVDRFTTGQSTYTVDASGKVAVMLKDVGEDSEEGDELLFDGTRLAYEAGGEQSYLVRATAEQIEKYKEESDDWHGGSAEVKYLVADYKPKGVDNSQWMKQLLDDRLVADLSLPGSHDACTGEGWQSSILSIFYETTAKTQDLTIAEQLKVGVRVFDLRPEYVMENGKYVLRCCHGISATKMLVSDFFKTLQQWLAANPTEFCIVTVDLSATSNKKAWGTDFNALITSSELKSMFADFKARLTVGEMRGKVLILSKWEYAAKPIGGYCYGWVYDQELVKQQQGHITAADGSETPLWVQDYWKNITRTKKDEAVLHMLEAAVGRDMTADKPAWVINYPSAYIYGAFSDFYRENAVAANKVTIDWLAGHTGSVGIIYMDFCGMDMSPSTTASKLYDTLGMKLIESVISQNFK